MQWFRFQIFRIDLHSSSKYKYLYSHRKSNRKSLFWSETQSVEQSFSLDQIVSRISSFEYFQMIYHIICSQISWLVSRNQISNWNSKTFSSFLFCICTSHWWTSHAYFNCFNNFFTFRFRRQFSRRFSCQKKRSFHHTKRQIFLTFNDSLKYKVKRFAEIFFAFFVVFVVFNSDLYSFSRLSRSLWTLHVYEQVIKITYFVDRWEKKKQWVKNIESDYASIRRAEIDDFKMFVISQKFSRQFQIRYTLIFMLIFSSFFLSSLRYLQSKFTTHEELNRVKNIFKNCCSILLNCEKITRCKATRCRATKCKTTKCKTTKCKATKCKTTKCKTTKCLKLECIQID